jgi:hypothetical protein
MHMALLPLPGAAGRGKTGRMTTDALARRLAGTVREMTGTVREMTCTVREMNDAVRLMTEIRLARPLGFDGEVPATYAEFLLRTSATSVHEPSAARRQSR